MDRNRPVAGFPLMIGGSLSARRAWIEIVITAMTSQISVSLSARRAWIEIFCVVSLNYKEVRRSPQGERG